MSPNVVFIALDTMRADHLSCYGYPKPTTPHGVWKYMRMEERLAGMPAQSLFNLDSDPLETVNRIDEHPDIAAQLDAVLEDYIHTVTKGGPDPLHEQPISQRPWDRRKALDRA